MKNLTLSLAALALIAAFVLNSCKSEAPTEEVVEVEAIESGITGQFMVDPSASSIEWLAKKVTGEHFGTVKIADGKFTIKNSMIEAGTIIIDMNSIVVTDIEDEEMNAKLTGHLNSEDFFNTAVYNEAKLNIVAADESYAKAELTIKNVTELVKFPVRIYEEEGKVHVAGELEVDRTLFDIKYGSGKFFENLGDKAIDDVFTLKFNIVAQ